MFRRSNSGALFFLRREAYFKENAIVDFIFFMNMEIATKFEVVEFSITHN